ncbi:hypothetical protein [Actinomadura sp. 9N407]|uniref:hypothetical protein n=1 Tax=Actinomadura sp. 9N407 TaxID=3375154 RepID=UPI0037B939EC
MATPDGRDEHAVPGSPVPGGDAPGAGTPPALGGEIPFRPLSISEILDGAIACIRLYPRAVLGPSLLLTTVIQVAGSVAAYFFVGRTARDEVTPGWVVRSVGTQFTLGAFGLVLSALAIVLLAGLMGPVIGRGLFGRRVSLRGAWRDTRPRLGRLILTALAVTLIPLLALALPILPFALFIVTDAPAGIGVLAGIIGFPLGAVLMVWLYVLLVLAAPAVVMERQTVGGALKRAHALSRGRWWRTFGTCLLAILVTVFMGFFALRIPFLLVELLFFGSGSGGESATMLALAVDTVGRIVSWTVVLPFDAGVITLLYLDRRMRREGFDLELRTRAHERAAARTSSVPSVPTAPAGNGRSPEGAPSGDDEFFEAWRTPSLSRSAPQGEPVRSGPGAMP